MNYNVGQIIYLLNDKTLQVIPAQICEEVVRNTLEGKEVTYLIQMPDKKRTQANIANVQTQIFTDVEELQTFMIDNAKKMIDKLLSDASKLRNVFDNDNASDDNHPLQDVINTSAANKDKTKQAKNVQHKEKDDTMVNVDLGNGMKARVRVEDLTGLNL